MVTGVKRSGALILRLIGGDWSVIAAAGTAVGQVFNPTALAVDGAGNLYVADTANHRVLRYTPGR